MNILAFDILNFLSNDIVQNIFIIFLILMWVSAVALGAVFVKKGLAKKDD